MRRTGVNNKKRFILSIGLDKRRFGDCDPKTINDNFDVICQQDRYFLINLDTQEREELPSNALLANGWYDTEHDFWKTPYEFVNQDKIEELAKLCTAANRGFDLIDEVWNMQQHFQRISSFKSVTFRLLNPNSNPSEQHNNWMTRMISDGWSKGIKDESRKTHPNLVPYEELPRIQEVKDRVFKAICS